MAGLECCDSGQGILSEWRPWSLAGSSQHSNPAKGRRPQHSSRIPLLFPVGRSGKFYLNGGLGIWQDHRSTLILPKADGLSIPVECLFNFIKSLMVGIILITFSHWGHAIVKNGIYCRIYDWAGRRDNE